MSASLKQKIAEVFDEPGCDKNQAKGTHTVMTIAHQAMCIGCTACSRICLKKCCTHAPASG